MACVLPRVHTMSGVAIKPVWGCHAVEWCIRWLIGRW